MDEAERSYIMQVRKIWFMDNTGIILMPNGKHFIMTETMRGENDRWRELSPRRNSPRRYRARHPPDVAAEAQVL